MYEEEEEEEGTKSHPHFLQAPVLHNPLRYLPRKRIVESNKISHLVLEDF